MKTTLSFLAVLLLFNFGIAQTTWSPLHSVSSYSSSAIHVQNDSLLYTVGWDPIVGVNNGTGYHSSNYGNNWSQFTFDINAGMAQEIYFPNPDTGYFVSQNDGVIKTTNGGINWNNVGFSNNSNQCAEFLNSNTFYVGKGNGNIEKTTDGGINLTAQNTPTSNSINNIYFVNNNLGYATSEFGVILKTVDGGNNWAQMISGVTFNLDEINFPTADTGFVLQRNSVSNNGTQILKTVNGGTTWFTQTSNSTNFLYDIEMVDGNIGYIVGENSTVLKTLDGGQNWTPLITNLPTGTRLFDIFITNNTIYINGDGVFKATLPTNINHLVKNDTEIEIFPNPTSNQLTIDTELGINEIKIIDITGKPIKAIKQNTNVVNIADLSNGIYFIKLITDEEIITKKFVKQ
jgi:photosystem II stability/assembly factor-like uncharacterized protein